MKNWDFSRPLVFCAAFLLVLGILVLTGCSDTEEEPTTEQSASQRLEVVYRQRADEGIASGSFAIIMDKETGVHYLWYQAGYKGGLTTMYNADGTLYTGD